MSRVGYFSPEAYALAWFDRSALAEGWMFDELIAEPAVTPPPSGSSDDPGFIHLLTLQQSTFGSLTRKFCN